VAGTASSFDVTAIGSPLGVLDVSGELPAGLGVTGGAAGQGAATLSGTPGAGTGGTYPLVFSRSSGADTITQNFTLTVNEVPEISSPAVATARVGSAATVSFAGGGGYPRDAVLTLAGALPAGLSPVSAASGVTGLSGTPRAGAGGVYLLTLTATNSAGLSTTQAVVLTVQEDPYVTAEPSDIAVLAGSAASFTVGLGG
ncbi:putative Ig domain-containing protein, partial [Kitasatospora indigofera]|uniref:putative Ig domain-containing protein n=1 Tax=Kitasatospora indigofera TaxID=67307 RepID=UPI00369AA9E1